MTEFELKFQVPPHQRAGLEAALARQGRPQRQRLRARYFDTPSQALARAGVVLRLRQEGRRWVQTAKAPGASAFDRLEHNVALDAGSAAAVILERHTGTETGQRIEQALADAGETAADLVTTFATDVVRLSRTIEARRASVEISIDTGHIEAGGHRLAVSEAEFELKQGSAAGLAEMAQDWVAAHGLWLDPLSKAEAGLRLAFDGSPGPPRQARALPARPLNGSAWVAAALGSGLDQALWNARELAAGQGETEHVHQLRVALRRLRVLLGELAGLEALAPAQDALPALEALFRDLGEDRDRAVLLPDQWAVLEAAGAPPVKLPAERPDIGASIRSADTQAALLRLVEAQMALREGEQAVAALTEVRAVVAERLARLHRKAFRGGRRFDLLDEPARHAVRKQFKRLRYLSELARPLFAGKQVDRYAAELKIVQDALGRFQDAAAGRRHWSALAASQPAAWFGAGWCAQDENAQALLCRSACRETAKVARPFWD